MINNIIVVFVSFVSLLGVQGVTHTTHHSEKKYRSGTDYLMDYSLFQSGYSNGYIVKSASTFKYYPGQDSPLEIHAALSLHVMIVH